MTPKLKNLKLIYRKLKISDYEEFKELFNACFNKKISLEFFKWRYFNDKSSFCYGAFFSSKLIANVGIVSSKLNNNEKIFSRHSSMVLKQYQSIGIFSNLLEKVKKKFLKNARLVVMWPNKNNFASFGLNKKNIIKQKYYLYKTSLSNNPSKKIKNLSINEIMKLKNFIKNNDNFFLKNLNYFKKRYTIYKKNEYTINKFQFKKLTSFFILKRNQDRSGFNYVILDHFGSKKIISKHLSYLITNCNNLIFISKKKMHRSNYKLLDYISFKIGFIKRFNVQEKRSILDKKEIFLGDTDIFLTIG